MCAKVYYKNLESGSWSAAFNYVPYNVQYKITDVYIWMQVHFRQLFPFLEEQVTLEQLLLLNWLIMSFM